MVKPKPCVQCKVCGKTVSGYPSQKPKTCGRACQDKLWKQRCLDRRGNLENYIRKRREKAQARTETILRMADGRTSVRKIAALLGISRTTVHAALRKYRPKRDQ